MGKCIRESSRATGHSQIYMRPVDRGWTGIIDAPGRLVGDPYASSQEENGVANTQAIRRCVWCCVFVFVDLAISTCDMRGSESCTPVKI
jgi:hypothetical protein